jgi:hypothetical protein
MSLYAQTPVSKEKLLDMALEWDTRAAVYDAGA